MIARLGAKHAVPALVVKDEFRGRGGLVHDLKIEIQTLWMNCLEEWAGFSYVYSILANFTGKFMCLELFHLGLRSRYF